MSDEQRSAVVWFLVLITVMGSAAVFLFSLPKPLPKTAQKPVNQEESITITTTTETTQSTTQTTKQTQVQVQFPLNINTATKEELMQIRGIGETYASRIIEYRERNGSFITVNELLNIKGIGDKRLEAWREYLTCE